MSFFSLSRPLLLWVCFTVPVLPLGPRWPWGVGIGDLGSQFRDWLSAWPLSAESVFISPAQQQHRPFARPGVSLFSMYPGSGLCLCPFPSSFLYSPQTSLFVTSKPVSHHAPLSLLAPSPVLLLPVPRALSSRVYHLSGWSTHILRISYPFFLCAFLIEA